MSGIEFVEPTPQRPANPPAERSTPTRRAAGRRVTFWIAAAEGLLWLAAATLCVVSAFAAVYVVNVPGLGAEGDMSIDGWGRYTNISLLPGAHGTRFGVALVVVAALLVLGGILRLAGGLVGRARAVGTTVATVAVSALAGVAAVAYLEARSELDGFRAQLRLEQLDTSEHSPLTVGIRLETGWLVKLAAIAVLCGLIALGLTPALTAIGRRRARTRRRATRRPRTRAAPGRRGPHHGPVNAPAGG